MQPIAGKLVLLSFLRPLDGSRWPSTGQLDFGTNHHSSQNPFGDVPLTVYNTAT
jgi:hypothetical protein